ncbi:MAG: efflux RND transporter periplasmic adaptor subunit [Acidobacteria bacterium]|nr:efflux RND transporter periplasmic adaptor subunit [Acidobacteriota bacterium]
MTPKQIMVKTGIVAVAVVSLFWSIMTSGVQKAPRSDSRPAAAKTGPGQATTVPVTTVVSQELNRPIRLPGELQAFQDVALYPKIQGFVEWIGVDRGSWVKRGQPLVRMRAPEVEAQRSSADAKVQVSHARLLEAQARVLSARQQTLEAEAKLASDDATYRRLKAAAATPGVVAGNDLEVAQKTVEANQARVRVTEENEKAAQAQVRSLEEDEKAATETARSAREIESYLHIAAPFDGVITERNVHTGSLVGPSSGPASPAMLRIQQVSKLRLTIPVPEIAIAGVKQGAKLNFTVLAFPGEIFAGVVERIEHALEPRTRTMPVELDVDNRSGRLAPGMFPEVTLPVRRSRPSLFVPPSAVATTTERVFVVRIRRGMTEWIDVVRGMSMGDLIEVFGNLQPGDQVAVRGTDELRAGIRVIAKQATAAR